MMGLFNFGVRLSKEDRKLLTDIKDLLVNGLEGKKVVVTVSIEDKNVAPVNMTGGIANLNLETSDGN